MPANFPTSLDDNSTLHEVVDGVTEIVDEHHNNPKDAIIALEHKVGIYNTSVPTAIDYRLGHPTGGHRHDGASGQGPAINPTAFGLAATGIATLSGGIISVPTQIPRYILPMTQVGSIGVGSKIAAPVILGRTMQIESVQAGLRRGPSGATTALIIRVGPTHIFGASVGFGVRFAPGATAYRSSATPNLITAPSGAVVTLDAEAVGSSDPGQDTGITIFFRE